MEKIEVRFIELCPSGLRKNIVECAERMEKLFDEGFLILRADTTSDRIVYLLTRTMKSK